jgi:hypothetical protein
MQKNILLSFIIFISLTACKKQEEAIITNPIASLTNNDIKVWRYLVSKTDGKNQLADCNKDDRIIFNNATSKVEINGGLNKCIANEEKIEYDFSLDTKSKILKIDKEAYEILILTNKTLRLISLPGKHEDGIEHNHNYEITLEAI